jgi:predicted transcriptional regulator
MKMIRKSWSKRRKLSTLESTAMRISYEDHGCSLTELAKEYKVTAPTISKYIREAGGTIRKPWERFKNPLVILKGNK